MVDERLAKVICNLFSLDYSAITRETSSEQIVEWDSLGHLKLILEIENVFGIQFSGDEIPLLTSVGSLQDALTRYGVL